MLIVAPTVNVALPLDVMQLVQDEVKLLTVKVSTPFDRVIGDVGKVTENDTDDDAVLSVKLSAETLPLWQT